MNLKVSVLIALGLLTIGSCASADSYYVDSGYGYNDPYYGLPPVGPYAPVYGGSYYTPRVYYHDDPSVSGFVDRSAKTGVGVTGKVAKEAFKAVF